MILYPGEPRANVFLLGEVTRAVIELPIELSISQTKSWNTFPFSPDSVLESCSNFSSLLAHPTTFSPALVKSEYQNCFDDFQFLNYPET